jgi:hypothetical protein
MTTMLELGAIGAARPSHAHSRVAPDGHGSHEVKETTTCLRET